MVTRNSSLNSPTETMSLPLNHCRNILTGSTVAIVFVVLVVTMRDETAVATTKESATTQASGNAIVDAITPIQWNAPGDQTGVNELALDLAIAAASTRRAVLPTGWRRTRYGWERAEAWADSNGPAVGFESDDGKTYRRRFAAVGGAPPQTVSQWMLWDRAREPLWANRLLAIVRTVHPLSVAILLIATAILITRLSEPKLANRDTSGSLNT